MLCAALLAYPRPKSLASVNGSLLTYSGPTVPCGAGGTLYSNLTSRPINFDVELLVDSRFINFACSSTSLSWTDAKGHPQTLVVNKGTTMVVATSLPAGGTITWSTLSEEATVGFRWMLQRDQAASVDSTLGEIGQCGTGGSLYENRTGHSLDLDFAVAAPSTCRATISWTDAAGHAQTLDADHLTTEGASSSLPPGGVISWTADAGSADDGFVIVIDRLPVVQSDQKAVPPGHEHEEDGDR